MNSTRQTKRDEAREKFINSLPTLVKPEYINDLEKLSKFYEDDNLLPSKIRLSETENLKYDSHRVEFILQALQFLQKYYCGNNTILKPSVTLNKSATNLVEGINLVNIRGIIVRISRTIFNISGSVRVKYKDLLAPQPFTWETFEHLGGLMKIRSRDYIAVVLRNVMGDVAKRFADEYREEEKIIEASIPFILNNDIQQLWLLFSYIQKVENKSILPTDKIPLKGFVATKALTRRMVDMESLIQLLKYSDNHVSCFSYLDKLILMKQLAKEDTLYLMQVDDVNNTYRRKINLSSKLSRHAALRRLEMIGELITGKNFSSFIKELDPSTDWDAFIAIRDTIAHQDEGDNGYKINQLIHNDVLFEAILGKEMEELFYKLTQVVAFRDQHLPKFNDNIDEFFALVYEHEKRQFEAQNNAISTPIIIIKPRTTPENIDVIMNALDDNNVSKDIKEKFLAILDGSQPIPSTKEMGILYQYLPSKKIDKDLHLKCRSIIDEAIRPKTTAMQRELTRNNTNQMAKQRKQDKHDKFIGLVEIRKLACEFSKKEILRPGLTRVQRIEAAISSLENIKEFLEQDDFIHANFNFPNFDEWRKTQNTETASELFAGLLADPELNDALEYNVAQLLQQLDRISQFTEAKGHLHLDKEMQYESLRHLRNWVEHGNHLEDKQEYNPGENQDLALQERQKVVVPVMIRLIFDLLPDLYQLKDTLQKSQAIIISTSPTTIWQPSPPLQNNKRSYNDNEPCGPGYGF